MVRVFTEGDLPEIQKALAVIEEMLAGDLISDVAARECRLSLNDRIAEIGA